MTKQEQQTEALDRAQNGQSFTNYPAIVQGFIVKGIAEDNIEPRINVFTYQAWQALGRQVRRGERGVKVFTFIALPDKLNDEGELERRGGSVPKRTTVFHITQTDPK